MFIPLSAAQKAVRPVVAVASITAVTLCLALSFVALHLANTSAQPLVSADSLIQIPTVSTQETSSLPAEADTPIDTCVPVRNSLPSPVDLSAADDGLTQRIDAPTFYKIFGSDASELRSQISRCAPKTAGQTQAEYTGQTSYNLSWSYQYADTGGACKITSAKVGIHVVQTLPAWQSGANVDPAFKAQWNGFAVALADHESGHADLDISHAQQLLGDLRAFPLTPCSQLAQSVKQLTDSDVSLLEQANENYDSSTNHGATQGAILP
jgi:predicted secreted Zn-dependent protease